MWHAKGKECKYGEQCKYKHKRMCRFIERGEKCKTTGCIFSHDTSLMCKWDANFRYGERCKFIHTNNTKTEGQRNRETQIREQQKVNILEKRTIK